MKPDNGKRTRFGIAFSALCAVLLGLAFLPSHLRPLNFVGLVPMIVAQHHVIPGKRFGLTADIGVGGFFGLDWVRSVLPGRRNIHSPDIGEQSQLATTKIILADDQSKVRSALRFLLEQVSNWQVAAEVETADELFSQIEATRPDIILLDWELPGINGKKSVARLKACCGHVQIVALSSHINARKDALEADVDVFISKTDPPDRILIELRKLDHPFNPRGIALANNQRAERR